MESLDVYLNGVKAGRLNDVPTVPKFRRRERMVLYDACVHVRNCHASLQLLHADCRGDIAAERGARKIVLGRLTPARAIW